MHDKLHYPFNERDLLLGDPSGKAKLVWYIDYEDTRVRRARQLMLDVAERICRRQDAVIAVRPISRAGTLSANAVAAAAQQGQFAQMHRALLLHDGELSEDALARIATESQLDVQQFFADLHSDQTVNFLDEIRQQAAELGDSAPGLFVDNRYYDGVWDEESVIEAVEKPLGHRIRSASNDFFHWAASAGLVLIAATVAALVFVNVGYHDTYEHLRGTLAGFVFGDIVFKLSVEQWVNDGLMAIFFLLVGIEIKREIVDGELSTLQRALLPIIGAIGGMVVPAGLYAYLNMGRESIAGWGVPMATDIAFTLGLIALLGKRVPTSLIVFLSALAIADDLGAILVIAAFYGHGFHVAPFLWGLGVLAVMFILNACKVYTRTPYLMLGAFLWFLVHETGLHATLAGVLTAMAIPSRKSGNLQGVAAQAMNVFESEIQSTADGPKAIGSRALARIQVAVDRLRDPGYHLQHAIESWSNFLILPLFAFFNMGVVVVGVSFAVTSPESLGVISGLVIGKPLGIVMSCWLATKLGIAHLAGGITWSQMIGAGCLAGVGFTMSIFVATSAFEGSQLQSVKLSILIASMLSASIGMMILYKSANPIRNAIGSSE